MQAPASAEPFYIQPQDPPSKKAVLRAALRLFVTHGIAAVTVRDIAAAAEFSNPVIFKYFPTRDALAVQLFEACFREFSQRLERAIAEPLPIARRLHGLLETYWESVEAAPETFLYLHENWRALSPLVQDELRAFSLPRRVRKLLQDAQLTRAIGVELDPGFAGAAVTGVFVTLARGVVAGEPLPDAQSVFALCRRALSM